MSKFARPFARNESGATALEVSLLAGPVCVFVFGIIEVSRFYYSKHELVTIADRLSRQIILDSTGSPLNSWQTIVADVAILLKPENLSLTQTITPISGVSHHHLSFSYKYSYLLPITGTGIETLTYKRTIPITGF